MIAPSFSEYEEALRSVGAEVEYYYLCEEDNFQIRGDYVDKLSEEIDMIFLCNPNNPTGQTIDRDMLIKILDRCKKQNIVVILDECFLEFLDEPNRYEMSDLRGEYPNLLIIKAFTKYSVCRDCVLVMQSAVIRYSGRNVLEASTVECVRSGTDGGSGST